MEGPPADSSFKFTLRDDRDFNHTVFVDVLAIDGKNVLQVIDEATASQAARFLTNMSAGCTWNTLKECWIDFYLGPPAYVVHDAGTNFASKEFRDNARVMNVEPKEVPVEAHNSIGLVERYHIPLRRAYDIISQEVPSITKEHKLLIAVMLHRFCCFGLCRLDTQLEVTLRSLFISLQTSYTRTLFVFHLLSFDCWKAESALVFPKRRVACVGCTSVTWFG